MSCLVNPNGWRLYFIKYWKTQFYSSNKIYGFVNLHSKVFFEMINSLLSNLNKKIKKRGLLDLNSFKVILFNKEIHIIIKLNFYWTAFTHFRLTTQNRGGIYNFPLKNSIKKKSAILKYKENPLYFLCNRNLLVGRKRRRTYQRFFNQVQLYKHKPNIEYGKLLIWFFELVPLFHYLKYSIQQCVSTNLTGVALYNIYFLGIQNYEPNPEAILNLAEKMFRSKKYSTGRILHTIIKILVRSMKKYKWRGYKFLIAGRFTRRDRATYMWKSIGAVALGSRYSPIEFYVRPIQLKYSKTILKIWICR